MVEEHSGTPKAFLWPRCWRWGMGRPNRLGLREAVECKAEGKTLGLGVGF